MSDIDDLIREHGEEISGSGAASNDDHWRDDLLRTRKGTPKGNIANALTGLRHALAGIVAYDQFALRTVLRHSPPWVLPTEFKPIVVWSDYDDVRAAEWLQHRGINVTPAVAGQAAETIAKDNPFHPVREYLAGLRWDREPRLDRWMIDYLGAGKDTDWEYLLAVAAKFLISAVARVEEPGIQADCCPILEGPQGIGKSTALKILFQPWFADELADFGSKDAAMQLHGVWCVELAELDNLARSEATRSKQFISRRTDHFRPPYGRHVIDAPRQNVFAGTVNGSGYLKDETGARRFWPIACATIDIKGLGAVKDQLWAEAMARYEAGESWWMDTADLARAARLEQAARFDADVWHDKIMGYVAGRDSVTLAEVLAHIGIVEDRRTQSDANRVAKTLKHEGWRRKQVREGGVQRWKYVSPVTTVTA
jgi:predicted P-loop ATPase